MPETVKVLLIDDDEDEMFLMQELLNEVEGRNYQLDWSNHFREGLEKVLSGSHDVYLIDYRLGKETGIHLLAEIKKQNLDRAAIVLTGHGDPDVDNAALEMGASDYLVKGEFDAREIDRAIRYAIERCRSKEYLHFQAAILRNVHDAVFYITESGIVTEWNEGAARIFGLKAEKAIGSSIEEICSHHGQNPFREKIVPSVTRDGVAEEVVKCHLPSGDQIILRVKVTALARREEKGFVVCASDITRQKKLEAEIVRISENEQRRIGQDIHDDLCSQLSGIGLLAKALETKLADNYDKEARMMADIAQMVSDAGQKARRLAKGLVPSALETEGLSRAICDIASHCQKHFGITCVSTVLGENTLDALDSSVAVQLYRITQEATTNATKHSDAELIQIRLVAAGGQVTLEISDDGKGMPEEVFSTGMGMMTMRQRAEMINADFELHSRPGRGTRVVCRFKI